MALLFTRGFKHRTRITAAALTTLGGGLPFVAGLVILDLAEEQLVGLWAVVLTVVCFILGGTLPWFLQNRLGLLGNATLQRRLRKRLEEDGLGEVLEGAQFVGFSPGEQLRVWDGETDRDVGYLTVSPCGLTFYGDSYSWHLPRAYIDHFDITPVDGAVQRVIVRWHAPRDSGRTFALTAREAGSIRASHRRTVALHGALRHWLREPCELQDGPQLGLPPTDTAGGHMVEEPPSGACLTILAAGVIIIVTVWRLAGPMFQSGHYHQGILWSGLISVVGALVTGYLLHYLQAWEAVQRRRHRKTPSSR